MRAYEFIKENASSGGTSAGNVASVAQPLVGKKKKASKDSFFGADMSKLPKYGNTKEIAIIRRPPVIEKVDRNDS